MAELPGIQVDHPAPHVVRVLVNRPEKRNALDTEIRESLFAAITALLAIPGNRALVLGGVAGNFSSGGDVSTMGGLSEHDARKRMAMVGKVARLVESAPIPVVAACEGFVVGAGAGLALLCDYLVADNSTKFMFPFLKLGLSPDWGVMYTLPRRVGVPTARRLLLSGKTVTGKEARAIDLVDECVEDSAMGAAVAKAAELAQLPLPAYAAMKKRVNNASPTLAEEMQREEDDQSVLLTGPELREGLSAFKEKRAADFTKF